MTDEYFNRLTDIFGDKRSSFPWGTDPDVSIDDFPSDVRFALEHYGGLPFELLASIGPRRLNYARTQNLLHAAPGHWLSISHVASQRVIGAFERWVFEFEELPEEALRWAPSLVPIVGGYQSAFCLDFAYDRVTPPVVYISDDDWEHAVEGFIKPEELGTVAFVASSIEELVLNLSDPNDVLPRSRRQAWEPSEQESAWVHHRNKMLGL